MKNILMNMHRMLRRRNDGAFAVAVLATLAAAGLALSLVAFWPGFMEFDSYEQYDMAAGLMPLENWHPASMTLLWRALLAVCNGPQPMLVLQLCGYWAAFFFIAVHLRRSTGRFLPSLFAMTVPFAPFLLNFAGVIWKDTHMALAFFWAAILLVFGKSSPRKLLVALLLICYGISVRHNGIAAAVPLLILWSAQCVRIRGMSSRYGGFIMVCAALSLCLATDFALNRLFTVKDTISIAQQLINDSVSITCNEKDGDFQPLEKFYGTTLLRIPAERRSERLCAEVAMLAKTDDTGTVFDNDILAENDTVAHGRLLELWARKVLAHPLLYLEYRAVVFTTFLRPPSYANPYYVQITEEDPNPLPEGPNFRIADAFGMADVLRGYVTYASTIQFEWIFFRPFFWLAALAATMAPAFLKRRHDVAAVAGSGFLYVLLLFPVLPAPDFRYCYYALFAQVVAVFLAIDHRFHDGAGSIPVPDNGSGR